MASRTEGGTVPSLHSLGVAFIQAGELASSSSTGTEAKPV
jgi:hypothetical protein